MKTQTGRVRRGNRGDPSAAADRKTAESKVVDGEGRSQQSVKLKTGNYHDKKGNF